MLSDRTANDAFEVILKQALLEDMNREFDGLEVPKDIPFSNEFHKNVEKIHRIYKRQIRKKRFTENTPKIVGTAASVALVVSLALNPHVQAAVREIIERIFGQYTQYEFYSDEKITLENFNYNIEFSYIPDGYILRQVNYQDAYVILKYENYDKKIVINYAIANETDLTVDNEHSTKHDIYVNNAVAIFYESFDATRPSRLLWNEKGYCFMLTAQIELEEFVGIAENIKFD